MASVSMKTALSALCLYSFLSVQGATIKREAKYPRFERSCYRNMASSELGECLKANFQSSIPRFKSAGIPGVYPESIDPLYWPVFSHYFGGDLIKGALSVKELSTIGWSNMKISAVRANVKDPQKMLVDFDWKLPQLDIFGHFKLDGRIGLANFRGAGPFILNLTSVSGTWRVSGSRQKGEPFMKIGSFRGVPKFEGFKLKAAGAALGNEALSNVIVATINRGWRILYPIAVPAVDREWGNFCKEKLNRVFLTVPYDELFPLNPPSIKRSRVILEDVSLKIE